MTDACPLCRGPLVVQAGAKPLGKRADCYEECRDACPACRVGLTNATGPLRTFIRKDWKDGLWRPSTAARLEAVIARSLNERSRPEKLRRLAHERSEDLLTWNVFSWLEDRRLLSEVLAVFGCAGSRDVQVFYWGANDRYPLPDGRDLRRLLTDPERFDESPQSLSEPDLILVCRTHVVFVEAKLGSPNKPAGHDERRDKYDKYVNAMPGWFVERERVRAAGYYELTRNWAIGAAMATALGREFTLVNLVRASDEADIVDSFGRVVTARGVFRRCTWEEVGAIDSLMAPCLGRQTLYFQPVFPAFGERCSAASRRE